MNDAYDDMALARKPNASGADVEAYAARLRNRYPHARGLTLVFDTEHAVRYVRGESGGYLWRATLPNGRTLDTVSSSRETAREDILYMLNAELAEANPEAKVRKKLPRGTTLNKVEETFTP